MKNKKLIQDALDSFIEVCSDLHEHDLDRDEEDGRIFPIVRRAYKVLCRLEKAKLVEFNEPGCYAKILKKGG